MKHYDLIIVGWGKGGKTIAAKLSKLKPESKIAIIERDPKMFGGTCINVGCLPSKSFVHNSKIWKETEKLGRNWTFKESQEAFKHAIKHKENFVAFLNSKNYHNLADLENVTSYVGVASFVNSNTIKVKSEDKEEEISADKIIINTGSKSREYDVEGAKESKFVHDSTGILNLQELPKKLLIIGAGFIGLEFASYFNNFGTEVTVAQFNEVFLASEDIEDVNAIKEQLIKSGIKLLFNTSPSKFVDKENSVSVSLNSNGQTLIEEFDAVLTSVGRIPNLDDLELEKAGVEVERGAIKVNDLLETTTSNIWAIGDVKGSAFFTYVSLDDSRIVLPQLLGKKSEYTLKDRNLLPTTTFLDPAYARVGLNEKQAQEQGIEYTLKKLPVMAIPKAHVISEKTGFIKILVDKNDYVIGATLWHYEAAEMINILSLAIKFKIKASDLGKFIYTHPIFTEALNEVL